MTILGRFLEGSLSLTIFGWPNFSLTILSRPNMVRLKFPSKNRPNRVKCSSIPILFLASLFFPCWRASEKTKLCLTREFSLSLLMASPLQSTDPATQDRGRVMWTAAAADDAVRQVFVLSCKKMEAKMLGAAVKQYGKPIKRTLGVAKSHIFS